MPGIQPVHFQCGKATLDGNICQAPKQKGKDHCAKHSPEKQILKLIEQSGGVVPEISLDNITEIYAGIGDTINRLRKNEIKPEQAKAMFAGYNQLRHALALKEQYDPKKVGTREITREAARRLTQSMDIKQIRAVAMNRDKNALKNMLNSPQAEKIFADFDAEKAAEAEKLSTALPFQLKTEDELLDEELDE